MGRNEFSTFVMSSVGVLIYAPAYNGSPCPTTSPTPDDGYSAAAEIYNRLFAALFNIIANVGLMLWGGRELPKRFLLWTIYNTLLLSFFWSCWQL